MKYVLKFVKKYLYFTMACKKCKQNRDFKEELDYLDKYVIVFVIIWSLLAIYGLISLIKIFI
jgi:hypothetical protein